RADAEAPLRGVREVRWEKWSEPGRGVGVRFWSAGSVLGRAWTVAEVQAGVPFTPRLRLLFSGDLGPAHKAFHPDPDAPEAFDYVIVESTYGGRNRAELTPEQRRNVLRDEVLAAMKRGGNLLIPSFAIDRSQELMLDFAHLFRTKALPQLAVYIDSPLAVRVTKVFADHAKDLEDMEDGSPFTLPNFHFVETVEQSKAINRIAGGAIIMSASGMCEA